MPKDVKGIQVKPAPGTEPAEDHARLQREMDRTTWSATRGPQRPGLGLDRLLQAHPGRTHPDLRQDRGRLPAQPEGRRAAALPEELLLPEAPGHHHLGEHRARGRTGSPCAARYATPVLVSELHTAPLVSRLSAFLYQYFSKKIKMNGVLMDIMGQGVLITGASGIGKSETALELVNKGYQLIADDVTEFYLDSNDDLVGRANEIIKNLMEVRGLGIININDIFGASAVLEEKKLNLVINLEKWDAKKKYDRLGEDNLYFKILGLEVPLINLPVGPGRNLSTIIEVALRNFLAKKSGRMTYLEARSGSPAPEAAAAAPEPEAK
ncbi:MAG: HPr(Ser) kinase/phosphatase [Desulfobacterales bacterium]|nr:HPr(Ser) kinase/phosphatase [Desulfobacterales bacterium]